MDASLFPDRWPDRENLRPAGRRTCCDHLDPPDNVRVGLWRAVHQMGHSRVAFSDQQLAVLADAATIQATYAIGCALALGWIVAVHPEPYMTHAPGLYQGALPKR